MTPRTFLITGASKGIGRAISARLAAGGHRVVGIARHADPSFPGDIVPVDLGDPAATKAALADIVRRSHIDGVVNNVGRVRPQLLDDVGLEDLASVLDFNLRPALQAVQAVLPKMRSAGFGRIVNISSLTVLGIVFQATAFTLFGHTTQGQVVRRRCFSTRSPLAPMSPRAGAWSRK